MPPAIAAHRLSKSFRYARRGRGPFGALKTTPVLIEAVAGVSFEIMAGERVAVIGPNGAGKSTTLKMLTGFLVLTPVRLLRAPSARDAAVLGAAAVIYAALAMFAFSRGLRRYRQGGSPSLSAS